MTRLPIMAEELREGDMPTAYGFRPVVSVRLRPRLKRVEVRVGREWFRFPYGQTINVRRST